jgi:hypothetical protein
MPAKKSSPAPQVQIINVIAEIMCKDDTVESEEQFDWCDASKREEFLGRAECILAEGGYFQVKPL